MSSIKKRDNFKCKINNKDYLIHRSLKRTKTGINQDECYLYTDGIKKQLTPIELRQVVLNLLNYPKENITKKPVIYRYTVYTPQEQMKQIILEDAETRLNVLRHVLGIDKYKRIRENLTLLLNHLKEESKVLQGEIKSLDEEKLSLELKKTNLKKLVAEIEIKAQTLEERKSETKNLESEVSQLEGRIKEVPGKRFTLL